MSYKKLKYACLQDLFNTKLPHTIQKPVIYPIAMLAYNPNLSLSSSPSTPSLCFLSCSPFPGNIDEQLVGKGWPQSPALPTYDSSLKVPNWLATGICPERLLYDKFKRLKNVMEAMLGGIEPEIWLCERSRLSKFVNDPMLLGMFPVSWFQDKFRAPRWINCAIFSGISPERLFLERSMIECTGDWFKYSVILPFRTNSICLVYGTYPEMVSEYIE